MKAKTVSINYEPGEFYRTSGHKSHERAHYKNGRYVNPTGFGWATESRPSKIVVGINIKGVYAEVLVDLFFKKHWGNLTTGRVAAIEDTLPGEVDVSKYKTVSGGDYYVMDEDCLQNWLKAAKAIR